MSHYSRLHRALAQMEIEQKDSDLNRASHEDERVMLEQLKQGKDEAIEQSKRIFAQGLEEALCRDPLRSGQYHFAAAAAVYCRACIAAGLPSSRADNLVSLYTRQADSCHSLEALTELHTSMMESFLEQVREVRHQKIYSRPVYQCMNLIDRKVQQPLTLSELAEELNLTDTYLSALFRKETGITVTEYIRRKRIETAKYLLCHTQFSCIDVSEYLSFSSPCHFSNLFRKYTKMSPTEYRRLHGTFSEE